MYGLVNRAIEEMIRRQHGDETWERIKAAAGVDVDLFVRIEAYPDDITYRLVAAASADLGISSEQALQAFGEYWVLYTAQDGYGALLDGAGSSVIDVLVHLDDLHAQVRSLYPNLSPPSFRCTDVTGNSVHLHYHSHRPGLAAMVVGLIQGLGKRLGTPVDIQPALSRERGDDHDSFVVRMAANG